MRPTDYTKIAHVYDSNAARFNIAPDPRIRELATRASGLAQAPGLAEGGSGAPARVLDLACGTGNYMAAQLAQVPGAANIEWHGLDASDAMLDIARTKLPGISLQMGTAEAIAYDDASFDYVVCRFAFHHFTDKPAVLDELTRVLKPGGTFTMVNVIPEYMPGWWVYYYCPETRAEDMHRFWPKDLITHELRKRGFSPHLHVAYDEALKSLDRVREDYVRRDVSQLAIAADAAWQAGLDMIDRQADAGIRAYHDEFALLELQADFS